MSTKEVTWTPPEWPPLVSGSYSADLTIDGEVASDSFSVKVTQENESANTETFTGIWVNIEPGHCVRVKDYLNEYETRAALGPHCITKQEK